MKMQVGKWGNSLAVRLPREIVDRFNLKEGDAIGTEGIEAVLEAAQTEEKQARRAAALAELEKGRFTLPTDWKLDREQADWRPWMDKW